MWNEKNEKNEAPIYRRGLTFNKVVSSSIEYHIFMSQFPFFLHEVHGQDISSKSLDLFPLLFASPLTILGRPPCASICKFVSSFSFGKYLDTFMHKIFSLPMGMLGAYGLLERASKSFAVCS